MKRTALKRGNSRLSRRKPLRSKPSKKVVRRNSAFKPSNGGFSPEDQVWSRTVIERDRTCRWPGGCHTGMKLTAHHGIRRNVQQHRHDPNNGICLCIVHHADAETDPKEWKMTPSDLGDAWLAAGGWWQNRSLTTPGMWRRKRVEGVS